MTSTVPVPADEVAVIWVALLTAKDAAATPPNLTEVAAGEIGAGNGNASAACGQTGIRTDVGDRWRRHITELVCAAWRAGTPPDCYRNINDPSPSR